MPHSNFKEGSHTFSSGIGKCSCGQTFDYVSKPPKNFDKIAVSKKAKTMKEQQISETERIRKIYDH